MRFYENAYELMSEMGRDLWEMGTLNKPKTYQNEVIEGNEDFITKEEICKQYCLTGLPDPEMLFIFTKAKDWAEAEFAERISGKQINPGKAWELRKDMWEEFLVKDMFTTGPGFDYTYPERINQEVTWKGNPKRVTILEALIELLKQDHDTRKAVLPIFTDRDCNNYDGSARIPCSMYYDFLIRDCGQGPQVNIVYHQRSSDFVGHFGDDVYLAWCMMEYVAEKVGVKAGFLYHTIDSLHCYQRDWHYLKTSVDDIK